MGAMTRTRRWIPTWAAAVALATAVVVTGSPVDAGVPSTGPVTITKTSTGAPVSDPRLGTWTVTYDVVITNGGAAATTYDLDDVPALGTGADLASVSVVGAPAGVSVSPTWDGRDDTRLATGVGLPLGGEHTYRVAVSYRPSEYEVTAASSDCVVQAGEAATGITNTAAVTSGAVTRTAEDCETFSAIVVEKDVVGTPVVDGDRMTVTYDLAVTNRGSRDGTYDLDDDLRFGDGITPVSATVENTAPGSLTPIAGWDGVDATGIVADQALGAGATHTFRVQAVASVGAEAWDGSADCILHESEIGTGLTNFGHVTVGGWTRMDDACAPVDLAAATTTSTTSTTATTTTTSTATATTTTGTLSTGAGASRSGSTSSAVRGELVRTGSPLLGPAVLGGVLLLAGYGLVRAGRRAST